MNEITSPPVRYTGSKWRIADWVIKHFPKHTCYVEPFCGGASVLFRKTPSAVEVINDLNGDVVNFFDVLRNQTADLLRVIELTPYSRVELERAMIPSLDPLERARQFYIKARQSYTAGQSGNAGWRFEHTTIRGTRIVEEWNKLSHLLPCAARLKMVQIENDSALNIINRFDGPETLFYCDPPYVHSTRSSSKDYVSEMSDTDHETLAEALRNAKGMVLISGYDSPLYQRLFSDWSKVFIDTRTIDSHWRTECLWISPAAQSRQSQKRLF